MKVIGVLVHSLTIEYSICILNGITDYFKEKDVKIVIAQVKGPNYSLGLYEYQEWASVQTLFSEQVDGVIALTGSFSSTMKISDLEDALRLMPEKPIVSIATKLNLPNVTTISTENNTSYEKLITHMVKAHKCKRFAFLGPDPEKSEEGKDRYNSFLRALEKNRISFDKDNFFYGDFSAESAEEELTTKLQKKSDVKFDCLVCANDIMALTAKDIIGDLGFKIPDQIKIVGYDNTSHSRNAFPILTTIDQNFYRQGFEAAEIVYKKALGKKISDEQKVHSQLVIKESCGCKYEREIISVSSKRRTQLVSNGEQSHFLSKLARIAVVLDMSKASDTSRQIFYTLKYMIENADIEAIAVCTYDEPVVLGRKDPCNLPDKITLSMLIDNSLGIEEFEKGISFNLKKTILPPDVLHNRTGNYLVHPIYSGEQNYGYVVCRLKNEDYAVTIIFIRVLISKLAQAFEYTNSLSENKLLTKENKELLENNSDLSRQSRTDELTRLLNRRGFMELGQNHIDLAMEDNDTGLVFFADLDGLKTINDKYGHKMGDAAIKAMGSILSQLLRANDIVGRLSGDEFAGVAIGMNENLVAKLILEAKKQCADISQQYNFPFELSFSIGYSKFDSKNHVLKELLEQADKILYQEKKIRHAQQKL